MSKLIDKLNRTANGSPQAIGFRARQAASPNPEMLLIASLTPADAGEAADRTAGADSGMLSISKTKVDAKAFRECSQAVPGIPWGIWLKDAEGGKTDLKGIDCDFIVFPASVPLRVIQDNKAGKILEVEASVSEGLLRTINKLPLDAVLIVEGQKNSPLLTWQHLMLVRHFATSLAKPLLVPVPAKVTANELGALWESGADGVIVAAGDGQAPEALSELRRAVDKLALSARRRQDTVKVLLPQITREITSEQGEEEEEEEEEEE
ncbi:MAG: hypothetical protein PHQ43_03850 [Dehalococcoidales bacterium]|nr:hypothetical protein [Dehalococcoidales bacterium]